MDVLGQFREKPLPPSGVDVARAIRVGRRQRRTRAGAAAISLVAVVAAATVTAPQWQHRLPIFGDGTSGVGVEPTASLTCDPLEPLPELAAEADGATFDLLRRQVDTSAVTNYRIESYATSRYWQRLELVNASKDSTVEVTLYGAGGEPVFASMPSTAPAPIDPTTGTATDPVGNAAAYWLPGRQGLHQFEVARLGWQWAPDAWVFVAAADTSNFDGAYNETPKTPEQVAVLRGIARQVATALRLGADLPVTSPFTMPVPACTRLVGTTLMSSTTSSGGPFTRFTLTFGEDGWASPNPLLRRPDQRSVTVTADSVATPASKPGSATLDIDGHPAAGDGDFRIIHDVDGFALELRIPGGEQAVEDLFRTVQIVPGAEDDQSGWVDTPLRP